MANEHWDTEGWGILTEAALRKVQVGVRSYNMLHLNERMLVNQYTTVIMHFNDTGATDAPTAGYPGSTGRMYNHLITYLPYDCKYVVSLWGSDTKNEGTVLSAGYGILWFVDDDGDVTFLTDWFDLAEAEGEPDILVRDIPANSAVYLGLQVENGAVAAGTFVAIVRPDSAPLDLPQV